ncbi:glycosyltransferase involved in cell wall biosynthesis [Neobacillus niacini]|uniref:glycosyltransferase n=1 Tax=Neobacillus niacini TaxID=86668 RepID=UPI002864FC7A|nr:glycosyltransferase [Neobacillus niacini]MDR7079126.1 glycosyltransferase involved in cell wall biosynthesis [Neobacillus niacini]
MKKKILFVNGHLNVGGVENSLINLLKSIDYNYYDIDLILFEELGDYSNEVPKEVNIIYYDLSKAYGPILQCILQNIKNGNWFALILRLIFLIEKVIGPKTLFLAKPLFKLDKNYHCAIAYRVGICTDFVGYVINSKNKVTWWHHGTYDYPVNQTKRLIEVFKKFNKIIVVSDSTKKMLEKNIQGINDKFITISNIINVDAIRQKATEETIFDYNNNENITLLSIGRLSPEKGMINCVHACKKLVDNGYFVKWYLIGEGTQRGEIEECIKDYQLENNIYLLGAISNPYPYIKNAHIYVHPSLVESLSITVLEALALNTPVTVARSMGPEEFLRHNENGLLVEPTPAGLFKGIVSLIKDDHLYNQMKNDKSDVLKKFSPKVIMEKIYNLIEVG